MTTLYLDDVRATPQGFDVRTYTAKETIERLSRGDITHCSLDHDLDGDGSINPEQCGTGYDVAVWIEQSAYNRTLRPIVCIVHSMNASGRAKMEAALRNARKYWAEWEVEERAQKP